jgi:hypothetical protein
LYSFCTHTPQSLTPLRRPGGRNIPFRVLCSLAPAWDYGTAYRFRSRRDTSPARLRYALPCLTLTGVRLSTHLRSIRKSLDASAPSGEHPAGPIDRSPALRFVHSGKQRRRPTKQTGYRPVGKPVPTIPLLALELSNSPHRKQHSMNRPLSPASGQTHFQKELPIGKPF